MGVLKVEGLEFRAATLEDMAFLVEMRRVTMQRHVEAAGLAYEEADQLRRVGDKLECARIVVLDGVDIGLLKVDRSVRPWHLHQVQVLPGYQGRGIGTRLVQGVLNEAGRVGVGVGLTVLNGNAARTLYERLGFVLVKQGVHAADMRWTPG